MLVYGSGLSDGNRHEHEDVPILLGGRGGGAFQAGRHVRYSNGTSLTNLYASLLDRMGVHPDHNGDSTGKLSGLAGV